MSCSNVELNSPLKDDHALNTEKSNKLITQFEKLEISIPDKQSLAGKVESIIENLGVITVKAVSTETLLHLGTHLFMQSMSQLHDCKDYILLGHVIEVFGTVSDPMYAIETADLNNNQVVKGMPVYFNDSHPDTHTFTLKILKNRNFEIIHQK